MNSYVGLLCQGDCFLSSSSCSQDWTRCTIDGHGTLGQKFLQGRRVREPGRVREYDILNSVIGSGNARYKSERD